MSKSYLKRMKDAEGCQWLLNKMKEKDLNFFDVVKVLKLIGASLFLVPAGTEIDWVMAKKGKFPELKKTKRNRRKKWKN
jgi:hypothetical protein